jgi:transposase
MEGFMHKRYVVKLDKHERNELSQLVKKEGIAAKKRTHAQVLLLADGGKRGPGWKDTAVAEACQVTVQTVENIRKRLVLEGLEAALQRKKQVRPSRQKILDGENEARVVATCCGSAPKGHARWTLRLLTERIVELQIVEAVSHETVRRCLKKTN